ncbi:hypothetical protein [Stenotrophomonas pavanii]|nr:hypothetical protein [Stenotrophomonas pavanii]
MLQSFMRLPASGRHYRVTRRAAAQALGALGALTREILAQLKR